MKSCVSEGLSVKVNIICGFPKETRKHLIETIGFIIQTAWVGCRDMSINQFSPYPGSELFEDLLKANKIKLDENYFRELSYYSSMTNAQSYSDYLSNLDILIYKTFGASLFYFTAFIRRPWRLFQLIRNIYMQNETDRLEKTLISYLGRFRYRYKT